jgi:hypothetical protein
MRSDEEVKPQFGDYQLESCLAGLRGIKPDLPVDAAALEARAEAAMPPALLSYVQGGCGDEFTQRRNVEAFKDWGLVPRMLVDTSRRDLSIELFGMKLPHPLFMRPIGVAGICAQDGHGDLAIAEAARASGFPVTISTLGNDPIEKVGAVLGDGIGFYQLYTPKDRGLAESMMRCGGLDFSKKPVNVILSGPLGTGDRGWPSALRGIGASPPTHLTMEEDLKPIEENGFILADFTAESITVRYFRFNYHKQSPDMIERRAF